MRLSDIAPTWAQALPGEELHPVAALEDAAAVHALLQGRGHRGALWGAFPPSRPVGAHPAGQHHWGLHNLYEAARKQGVKRIVFASSNHVTGFYRQDEVVGLKDPDAA